MDVIAGDSTNGLITKLGLFVLTDDKRYFPSYHAAPVMSGAVLARFPELREAVSALAGAITDEEMRRLNYLVDGERRVSYSQLGQMVEILWNLAVALILGSIGLFLLLLCLLLLGLTVVSLLPIH